MKVAVVTGAYGGLGKLIIRQLELSGHMVFHWDLPVVDVTDGGSIQEAASKVAVMTGNKNVDVLVNCAGFNKLAPIGGIALSDFDRHMAVNARALYLVPQIMLPELKGGTICNVISNASHMPMRMSLAYNASKAAAAMITRQMARELAPHVTVFGVSPNRLAGTPMSNSVDKQVATVRGWTEEEVRQKQLEALPIGEETDPAMVAEFIGFLLSSKERHRYLHGSIMEYGI
jgi:NAD(P)-dependent dehydrogenase (short-subunit alcohol dehydrogenase family)